MGASLTTEPWEGWASGCGSEVFFSGSWFLHLCVKWRVSHQVLWGGPFVEGTECESYMLRGRRRKELSWQSVCLAGTPVTSALGM